MFDPSAMSTISEAMPAIRQFVATRLDLADEQDGATATMMRSVWAGVLDSVDVLDRAVAAELEDLPSPQPACA